MHTLSCSLCFGCRKYPSGPGSKEYPDDGYTNTEPVFDFYILTNIWESGAARKVECKEANGYVLRGLLAVSDELLCSL